jgi:hypothetical protein
MTTAYTSLLGLALPVTGELSGTWGSTVNTEITALLDSAVAGTTTISADADITLTATTGAANEAREAILLWTAGGTVTRNITAPAQSKAYIVINKSSSTQSIVLRGVGPTTGVTIVVNEKAVCAWNGSDFVKVASSAISNLTGTLPVANGGTGLTTTPANGALDIGNGTGFTRTTLTAGSNITITNGAGSISIAGNAGTVTSVAATVPSFLSVTGSPITTSGTLAIAYSGTALPVANGGTGVTTSTGTGNVVLSTSPTLVTPILGTPTSGNLANCTFPTLNQNTSGTAAGLSATLAVGSGGTGSTTLTANNVLLGNGTSALQAIAPSTSGNVLTSNGTTWTSAAPGGIGTGQTWQNLSSSRSWNTTYTNSTGKPIQILITGHCQPSQEYRLTLNGTATGVGNSMGGGMSGDGYLTAIIPDGNTYLADNFGSGYSTPTYTWWELR